VKKLAGFPLKDADFAALGFAAQARGQTIPALARNLLSIIARDHLILNESATAPPAPVDRNQREAAEWRGSWRS
jgi:hypothetical protein